MKTYILGSGGWIPTNDSETTSFLIEYKKELILIDAGTGVCNLSRYTDILAKYDRLSIVLTHYHIDHIIGLSYIFAFFKGKEIIFYGPGEPYYIEGVENTLKKVFCRDFLSRPLDKFVEEVKYVDYKEENFYINNIRITPFLQKHTNFSFGIRIDNVIYIATDTVVLDRTFENAVGVKVLLHECWSISEDSKKLHSSLESLIDKYEMFNVKEIGLIHKNPLWSDSEKKEILSIIEGKNIFIANDNQVIEVEGN